MVIIRLARMGKKGERKFRIVVKEKRSKRDGKAIEILGWYEKTAKKELKEVKNDRVQYWIAQGAQPTESVAKILGL